MGIFARIKKAWFDTIVWETIDDDSMTSLRTASLWLTSAQRSRTTR